MSLTDSHRIELRKYAFGKVVAMEEIELKNQNHGWYTQMEAMIERSDRLAVWLEHGADPRIEKLFNAMKSTNPTVQSALDQLLVVAAMANEP